MVCFQAILSFRFELLSELSQPTCSHHDLDVSSMKSITNCICACMHWSIRALQVCVNLIVNVCLESSYAIYTCDLHRVTPTPRFFLLSQHMLRSELDVAQWSIQCPSNSKLNLTLLSSILRDQPKHLAGVFFDNCLFKSLTWGNFRTC